MPNFPAEIISKIVEQVHFDPECQETFKEDMRIFNVLNSIDQLKPIISKCMSIWIIYPEEIFFNQLKSSQTLRDLRECTDSFFIITPNHPTGPILLTKRLNDVVPLIFDVHNFLGLEAPQSGLCLGLDQETFLEKLVLLKEKRPTKIIELTLPGGFHSLDMNGFPPWIRINKGFRNQYLLAGTDRMRLSTYKRISGTYVDISKEYDVPIDHKTIHFFPISEYDGQDYNKCSRDKDGGLAGRVTWLLAVPTKFWGPTPILNKIGIRKLKEIANRGIFSLEDSSLCQEFLRSFQRARSELWTDYQQQLFYSEYFRIHRAKYYYLIETLSSKKWK